MCRGCHLHPDVDVEDVVNEPVSAEVLQMLNRESDLGWNSTHGGGEDPPMCEAAMN